MDRKWLTLDRNPVEHLVDTIRKEMAEGERIIHIATDAQKEDRIVKFATCVILLKPGKGGRAFYSTLSKNSKEVRNIQQKLFLETQFTIEIATMLAGEFGDSVEYWIHLDVNPSVNFKSSQYVKELVGWVMGSGFQNVLIKPFSWAASHVCDHAVKHL